MVVLLAIVCLFVLLFTIHYLHHPAKITRDSRKWKTNDLTQRKSNEIKPKFLKGWTVVLESTELSKNKAKPVSAFGKELVVYRGSSNTCFVFDAYCPHLGANLGVGGSVSGDSIQCPFHGWVFDADGQCTKVPGIYEPIKANLKKYQTLEIYGFICVWYDPENKEPDWSLQTNNGHLDEKGMILRGISVNIFNCDLQDIIQHIADKQHLSCVHSDHKLFSFISKDSLIYKWFSKSIQLSYANVKWTPGVQSLIHTRPSLMRIGTKFNCFGLRELYSVYGLVQTEEKLCLGILRVSAKSGIMNNLLAKHFLDNSCAMWDRCGVVLVNKTRLNQPLLSDNEQSLKDFQTWIAKFQ